MPVEELRYAQKLLGNWTYANRTAVTGGGGSDHLAAMELAWGKRELAKSLGLQESLSTEDMHCSCREPEYRSQHHAKQFSVIFNASSRVSNILF